MTANDLVIEFRLKMPKCLLLNINWPSGIVKSKFKAKNAILLFRFSKKREKVLCIIVHFDYAIPLVGVPQIISVIYHFQ